MVTKGCSIGTKVIVLQVLNAVGNIGTKGIIVQILKVS